MKNSDKKRYIRKFVSFDDESIKCEIASNDRWTEFNMTIGNTNITLEFASTMDLINWCNEIKELAIMKLNDEG